MMLLKTTSQYEKIKNSCELLTEVFKILIAEIKIGMTTIQLDTLAETIIKDFNAEPAFKGYNNFPSTLCISVNNEVIHGIPGERVFEDGDIVSIDCGLSKNGWCSDAAITIPMGNVSDEKMKLIDTTKECLRKAIDLINLTYSIKDISEIIQKTAETNGFVILKGYTGHGLGKNLHEEPQIPNRVEEDLGYSLKSGMIIAIEPIILSGETSLKVMDNGWTIVSEENVVSSHFEKTIAVTDEGPEILTDIF